MSSKISGIWPQGRSTSKLPDRLWGSPPFGPYYAGASLDIALNFFGAEREDYLDWALEHRRKAQMMDNYYHAQMQEAWGYFGEDIDSPWHRESDKRLSILDSHPYRDWLMDVVESMFA